MNLYDVPEVGRDHLNFYVDFYFQTGEQWVRDPCTLCVCIGGTVVCTKKDCVDNINSCFHVSCLQFSI